SPPTMIVSTMPIITQPSSAITTGVARASIGRSSVLIIPPYSMGVWSALVVAVLLVQQPETMSLLEKPLFAPPLSKEERSTREAAVAAAREAYTRDPASVD